MNQRSTNPRQHPKPPVPLQYPVLQRDKHHQAGKPTELMRKLVRVCPVGGTVLDPFVGPATTGVAALLEGMNFVGMEVVPEYAAIAWKRLAEAKISATARTSDSSKGK